MMHLAIDNTHHLASTEEIIAEAVAGRMFILVDDEDRENEGDLIIPASCITPAHIAFMAHNGCGLICLAMDGALIDKLKLAPMVQSHTGTAFTLSIEAASGITTGISAADRAHTIQTAIAGGEISSPGHVFPLRARDGGVLVRRGHTEAAVDIARLAGHTPAGVICEIMKPDGTMARLPDLMMYAAKFGMKVGTIADLVAYRTVSSPSPSGRGSG
jgi:3,4-dihydroxy 2-butanone 4-phosphate synthase / GTP cyclohydrolase II